MMTSHDVIRKIREDPRLALALAKARATSHLPGKGFVATAEHRSDSDNGRYIAAVRRAVADQRRFERFKREPDYQSILEHTTRAQAEAYLDTVRRQTPDLLLRVDEFRRNDLIGSASQEQFAEVGLLSPSTARYMAVASDLLTYFGNLEGGHVVEIGVGYGGQMLTCDAALKMDRYTMFDLPAVLDLTEKYLESFLLRSSYVTSTLNQTAGLANVDLVISNYAFSELPAAVQRAYLRKVLTRSTRGYLTMNSGVGKSSRDSNKLSLDEIREYLPPSQILDEHPLTAAGNYILLWGEKTGGA